MSHLAKSIDTVTADLVEAQPVIQPGGAVTWVAFQRGGRRATSDDFNTATALTAGLVAAACLTVRAISLPNWLTDWPKALRGRLNLVSASSANRIHLRLRIRNEGRGPNLISDFTAAMNDEWSGPEITYPTPSGLLRQLLGLMSGDRVGELLAPLAARLASDEVETSIGLLDRESVDGIRSLIPERLPIPFPV